MRAIRSDIDFWNDTSRAPYSMAWVPEHKVVSFPGRRVPCVGKNAECVMQGVVTSLAVDINNQDTGFVASPYSDIGIGITRPPMFQHGNVKRGVLKAMGC